MADSPSDKRPPPQPHLLDLSSDCLRIILRLLAPRDVCTVSLVCSRLAALAVEDEAAWECFCAQSLEGQDRQSPGELPNFDTPATLRRQLGLRSFRALYQVLHQVGGWPAGLWQRVDDGAEPYGELLQVNPQRGRLVARSIIPTGAPKETLFTMSAVPLGNDSSLVHITTRDYAGSAARLRLEQDGQLMTLTTAHAPPGFIHGNGPLIHRLLGNTGQQQQQQQQQDQQHQQQPQQGGGHPQEHGLPLLPQQPPQYLQHEAAAPGNHAQPAVQQQRQLGGHLHPLGLGPLAWDHTRQQWTRMFHPLDSPQQVLRFRRLPVPTALHAAGVLPPLPQTPRNGSFPTLARLEGYWSACYGPHGLEIIHLRLAAGSEPGEAHCPCAASPRLLALKVTGDQNVPAGKVTLFTLEGAPTLGSYDGFEHGPDGAPLPDRPIVAFQEDGMAFVDLGEREVTARFQAAGQMSFIPGIWDPVWSSGQFIVYEGDGVVSMLFDDAEESFRHIIDYAPLPLPP